MMILANHSLVFVTQEMKPPLVTYIYRDLLKKAKDGVKDAGATPREFSTIAVSDGIAMGHEGMKSSLISREVIADFN